MKAEFQLGNDGSYVFTVENMTVADGVMIDWKIPSDEIKAMLESFKEHPPTEGLPQHFSLAIKASTAQAIGSAFIAAAKDSR